MKTIQTTLTFCAFVFFVSLFDSTAFAFIDHNFNFVRQPVSQHVDQGEDATFSVVFTGDGPFSLNWVVADGFIEGATNSTFILTNPPYPGVVVECVAIFQDGFMAISDDVACYVNLDTNPPVVNVTYPLSNQRVTNNPTAALTAAAHIRGVPAFSTTPVRGNSRDNKKVSEVSYQLNDSGVWQTAVGTTNWYDNLQLIPGTNSILVKCKDMAGNDSLPLLRKVFFCRHQSA